MKIEADTTTFLFVYGTLMRSIQHPAHQLIATHCRYLDNATVQARLYTISHYPGLILSSDPADKVYGELYQFEHSYPLLQQLDDYEECSPAFPLPHEYQRQQVTVINNAGVAVTAWTYLYNWPVNETNRIHSGLYQQ